MGIFVLFQALTALRVWKMTNEHLRTIKTKFKNKERPKVQEYLDYKMGNKKGRPNLSSSITRIIDNFISQNAN